jgi:hypothetical protein
MEFIFKFTFYQRQSPIIQYIDLLGSVKIHPQIRKVFILKIIASFRNDFQFICTLNLVDHIAPSQFKDYFNYKYS